MTCALRRSSKGAAGVVSMSVTKHRRGVRRGCKVRRVKGAWSMLPSRLKVVLLLCLKIQKQWHKLYCCNAVYMYIFNTHKIIQNIFPTGQLHIYMYSIFCAGLSGKYFIGKGTVSVVPPFKGNLKHVKWCFLLIFRIRPFKGDSALDIWNISPLPPFMITAAHHRNLAYAEKDREQLIAPSKSAAWNRN